MSKKPNAMTVATGMKKGHKQKVSGTSREKQKIVEDQITQFLRAGGKIKEIPRGVSGDHRNGVGRSQIIIGEIVPDSTISYGRDLPKKP